MMVQVLTEGFWMKLTGVYASNYVRFIINLLPERKISWQYTTTM